MAGEIKIVGQGIFYYSTDYTSLPCHFEPKVGKGTLHEIPETVSIKQGIWQ
jgi:hypothetical protein